MEVVDEGDLVEVDRRGNRQKLKRGRNGSSR
jgi:hypothetical protein